MSKSAGSVTAYEAYAFACMGCGRGWEQSFDIEHYVNGKGEDLVVYKTDGRMVPSPLTSPACPTCEGHVVRILRSGQVAAMGDVTQSHRKDGRKPGHNTTRGTHLSGLHLYGAAVGAFLRDLFHPQQQDLTDSGQRYRRT